jgi:hypothetical protein
VLDVTFAEETLMTEELTVVFTDEFPIKRLPALAVTFEVEFAICKVNTDKEELTVELPNVTAEVLTDALPRVPFPATESCALESVELAVLLPILKLVKVATVVEVLLLEVNPLLEITVLTVELPTVTEVFATYSE